MHGGQPGGHPQGLRVVSSVGPVVVSIGVGSVPGVAVAKRDNYFGL